MELIGHKTNFRIRDWVVWPCIVFGVTLFTTACGKDAKPSAFEQLPQTSYWRVLSTQDDTCLHEEVTEDDFQTRSEAWVLELRPAGKGTFSHVLTGVTYWDHSREYPWKAHVTFDEEREFRFYLPDERRGDGSVASRFGPKYRSWSGEYRTAYCKRFEALRYDGPRLCGDFVEQAKRKIPRALEKAAAEDRTIQAIRGLFSDYARAFASAPTIAGTYRWSGSAWSSITASTSSWWVYELTEQAVVELGLYRAVLSLPEGRFKYSFETHEAWGNYDIEGRWVSWNEDGSITQNERVVMPVGSFTHQFSDYSGYVDEYTFAVSDAVLSWKWADQTWHWGELGREKKMSANEMYATCPNFAVGLQSLFPNPATYTGYAQLRALRNNLWWAYP